MSESPATVVVVCTCGQKMKIPADATGRVFKCVRCGEHVKPSAGDRGPAPASSESSAAAPQAAAPMAHEPIGQRLVEAGLVSADQLQDALEKQKSRGGKTFELLIALGHLDKDELHAFLSRQPGIATIDLARFNISPDLIKLVPKKLAVENLVLPIDQLGKLLTVAMACPLDTATIATLEKTTGLRVKAMLCKLEDIHNAVQKYYPDRSRFEMSASHFDHILGKAEGPKEKVDDKIAAWESTLLDADSIEAITAAADGEGQSLDELVRVILEEPALSALLLRVANSELYGVAGRVDSVPMAVAVLGRSGVRAVLEKIATPMTTKMIEPLEPLKQQCRQTAAIAAGLARESGVMGANAAYSLGLLGEIGRLALAAVSPVKSRRIKAHLHSTALVEAEERLFSLDHTEVAGLMADNWRLPPAISRPLRYYTSPADAEAFQGQAQLLALAIALAYAPADDLKTEIHHLAGALQALKLSPAAVADVVNQVRATQSVAQKEG